LREPEMPVYRQGFQGMNPPPPPLLFTIEGQIKHRYSF
jgi:hypothetical protein